MTGGPVIATSSAVWHQPHVVQMAELQAELSGRSGDEERGEH